MEYYTAIGIDVSDKTSKICIMTKMRFEKVNASLWSVYLCKGMG